MGAHFLYKRLLQQGLSTLPFPASDFDLSMQLKNQNWRISSVHEGIQRGLRRLKKKLEKMESDPEKNARK